MFSVKALKVITTVCILSLLFSSVPLFVSAAEAHGRAHRYNVRVDVMEDGVCRVCGKLIYSRYRGKTTVSLTHRDGQAHRNGNNMLVVVTVLRDPETCSCSWS